MTRAEGHSRERPIGPGALVVVVGPSGAGKDTLIAEARRRLDDRALADQVAFVRRTVTRAGDTSAEDHDSIDAERFEAARQAGAFALDWKAHGLCYGLPASMDETVRQGGVAVANVSRDVIALLMARYARVTVVNVVAPPEVLAARLATRGRETATEIESRLARSRAVERTPQDSVTIDNSGPVEIGAEILVDVIRRSAKAPVG